MNGLSRTDTSILGRWWWTIDRWTLAALLTLLGIGAMLSIAASPAVAVRLGLPEFHFVRRHAVFVVPAVIVVLVVSTLSPTAIRRIAALTFVVSLAAMIAALLVGPEVNGATRWLYLAGVSVQPSEFAKPAFAVLAASFFAQRALRPGSGGYLIATALWILVVALLMLQPDLGMAVVMTALWGLQFFLAGMPMLWIGVLAALAIGGLVLAYLSFSHVADRINSFLDPSAGDTLQIERSLESFAGGGFFGTGPGEGTVKHYLPDAHTDFVFAVAGEEFGAALCILIVGLFGVIVVRSLVRVFRSPDLFLVIASVGLAAQFGIQALINMGSTLRLIPTKGMTLPFISYGGSSMIAIGLGAGMLLALTRDRAGTRSGP